MGIRHSTLGKPRISMTWILKGGHDHATNHDHSATIHGSKHIKAKECLDAGGGATDVRRREKRLHHRDRNSRPRRPRSKTHTRFPATSADQAPFGYEITDVDSFLTKASLDSPGNIPVVLSSPCLLYQTRLGGPQEELSLPLGMVVNAVFKNQCWVYVQTPHGEEGYVRYAACLPLGILPPRAPAPCWETHTDIFPMPMGNRDPERHRMSGSRSECGVRPRRQHEVSRETASACGERCVDRLYLRAAARSRSSASLSTGRATLMAVATDYTAKGPRGLTVNKGDVVEWVSGHVKDWFYVRDRRGAEGFIPAAVAGHGFL